MTTELKPPKREHSPSLLGDLTDFQERTLELLRDLAPNYGPVARIRLGPVTQYAITDPEGVQRVLQQNNRNYVKEQHFMDVNRTALLSGDDLFTSDGDAWLQRRRLMQPSFHRKMVADFRDVIVDETERMATSWQDGQSLDMDQSMMDVTMGIIGRTMLSRNILDDHPGLYRAFETVSGYLFDRATSLSLHFTPTFVPTARNRAFKRSLQLIRQTLGEIVNQRQRQPADERPNDLLTMLMAAQDDESGFTLSIEQLMDELFGVVTAGHETTSVTLSWLFYELARHPEVEDQLRAELGKVLGGRTPSIEDLQNLPYLQQVLDEAMRRYPAAYIATRQAVGADEIAGYPIPAGSTILINIYGLHHHDAYWRRPEQFDPVRWNRDDIDKLAFLPFGAGPRKCIGEPLAKMEMQLIVATVLPHFHFQIDPDRSSELVARFTLRSRDGVWLRVHRR